MCVVGACGPGRGGQKAHSAEGFSQITSASGWERGTTIHNTSLLFLHLKHPDVAHVNVNT